MQSSQRLLQCQATLLLVLGAFSAHAVVPTCDVRSGELRTPVIELYTSEGCSSCPPADQWLSTLKGKPVVAQAFHVAYWGYIGWADRFASRGQCPPGAPTGRLPSTGTARG